MSNVSYVTGVQQLEALLKALEPFGLRVSDGRGSSGFYAFSPTSLNSRGLGPLDYRNGAALGYRSGRADPDEGADKLEEFGVRVFKPQGKPYQFEVKSSPMYSAYYYDAVDLHLLEQAVRALQASRPGPVEALPEPSQASSDDSDVEESSYQRGVLQGRREFANEVCRANDERSKAFHAALAWYEEERRSVKRWAGSRIKPTPEIVDRLITLLSDNEMAFNATLRDLQEEEGQ